MRRIGPVKTSVFMVIFGVVVGSCYGKVSEEYAFPIPVWEALSGPADMTGKTQDAPAGKYGRVIPRSGHLEFENGTPVNFWGVGVSVSSLLPEFPPEDPVLRKQFVDKLASYGVNHVRIMAMDFLSRGFYDEWRKNRDFTFDRMDWVDAFVYELREAGIYYSFTLNHLSQKLQLDGVPPSGQTNRIKSRNYVQLFNSKALELQAEWIYGFMNHVNPYTRTAYVNDPAMVYFEAVNEDSIFLPFFKPGFKKGLTKENLKELSALFDEYLQDVYADTTELALAWSQSDTAGLQPDEQLGAGSIQLFPIDRVKEFSERRMHDQLRFFTWVETRHANRMKDAINQAAQNHGKATYEGLFTFSNNWYGYGYMKSNLDAGNYVEMHAYLDPQRVIDHDEDPQTPRVDSTCGYSFLGYPEHSWEDPLSARWDSQHLFRVVCSGIKNYPLLLTEWNGNLWNPHAYETPLLFTAYSAFQGYDIMDVHTFLAPHSAVDVEHAVHSYHVAVNPMFMALMPSLSLAFSRGYIQSPEEAIEFSIASDEVGFLNSVLDRKSYPDHGRSDVPPTLGFMYKIRKELFDAEQYELPVGLIDSFDKATEEKVWKTQPEEEVEWNWSTAGKPFLKVDTPYFQAVSGWTEQAVKTEDFIVKFGEVPGTLTAIALDNQPLGVSTSILVTVAGEAHNKGVKFAATKKGSRPDALAVVDIGKAPMLLRRVLGNMAWNTRSSENMRVFGLSVTGELTPIRVTGGVIPIGKQDSPWLWITFGKVEE